MNPSPIGWRTRAIFLAWIAAVVAAAAGVIALATHERAMRRESADAAVDRAASSREVPAFAMASGASNGGRVVSEASDDAEPERALADSDEPMVIRGRIVDPSGAPVANAEVCARREAESALARSRTNERGEFVLGVRESLEDVEIEAETTGFPKARVAGLPPFAASIDLGSIALEHFARLSGRVVDTNGAPIPSAAVLLSMRFIGETIDTEPPWPFAVGVDADGRFAKDGLIPGSSYASVRAPGYETLHVSVALAGGERAERTFTLQLEEPIAGRVVDELGAPVADAHVFGNVRVERDEDSVSDSRLFSTKAGDDGRYVIRGLPRVHGPIHLYAMKLGHGDANVVIEPDQTPPETIVLPRRPAAFATVAIAPDWSGLRTERLTRVRIASVGSSLSRVAEDEHEILDAATWRVWFVRTNDDPRVRVEVTTETGRVGRVIVPIAASGETRVDVPLGGDRVVSGTIVDASGRALAGAAVRLREVASDDDALPPRIVRASRDGAFRFDDLPEGRYDIDVSSPSGAVESVEVDLAARPHAQLALVATPVAIVRGRATRSGGPLAGEWIEARPDGEHASSASVCVRVRTDARGHFVFRLPRAGRYAIRRASSAPPHEGPGGFVCGHAARSRATPSVEAIAGAEVQADVELR